MYLEVELLASKERLSDATFWMDVYSDKNLNF